jgi:hypothetical protein
MNPAEKTQDLRTRLLVLQIQEAAQVDDSVFWPRSVIIPALERLIAKYERLDKQSPQAIMKSPRESI